MENGYVYDTPPTSTLDQETVSGEYTMIANPDMGHVGLYRRHEIDPADRLDTPMDTGRGAAAAAPGAAAGAAAGAAMAAGALGARASNRPATGHAATAQEKSWFSHPGVEAVKRDRGISL